MRRAMALFLALLLAGSPGLRASAVGDTEPPSVEVLSHGSNQRVGEAGIVLSGRAVDGGSGVALVEVRLNGGPWVEAEGRDIWSSRLRLEEGRNTISIRAVDREGNEGLANLTLVYASDASGEHGLAGAAGLALLSAALASIAALLWGRRKKD